MRKKKKCFALSLKFPLDKLYPFIISWRKNYYYYLFIYFLSFRDIGIVLPFDICHDCRSLFASKSIQTGDCILKVPYSVVRYSWDNPGFIIQSIATSNEILFYMLLQQIAPDNLLPEINSLLPDEIGNVGKLAIIILAEQKLGQVPIWLLLVWFIRIRYLWAISSFLYLICSHILFIFMMLILS